MDTGHDFIRAQLNNAIAQHGHLIESLRDHVEQADSPRYRELCTQYLPLLERHQGMLEQYGRSVGSDTAGGSIKSAIGSVLAKARDAVDSMRESDFLRLVADIVIDPTGAGHLPHVRRRRRSSRRCAAGRDRQLGGGTSR